MTILAAIELRKGKEGRKEGRKEGKKEGRKEGRKGKGREGKKASNLRKFLYNQMHDLE